MTEWKMDKAFIARKERRKRIGVLLQWAVLAALGFFIILSLLTLGKYVPYQSAGVPIQADRGFTALSYFGVSRNGDSVLIGQERLAEHLQALQQQGYVTITQQDIAAYYKGERDLPPKALFLMFEDGRRDTAIFTQKILESLNYKATVFSYAEKLERNDTKFLYAKELEELEDSTYWELGTNGYRLAFINVFDRYDTYIGQLDPLLYAEIAPYLGRRYNHYLMDYIRDADGIPLESYQFMRSRIDYDYERLRELYIKAFDRIPQAYVLMHANTGAFGNNMQVSAINERWIKELFAMNFNREGFSQNDRRSSLYDLTRMQPQSYWYTNHLLMRLKYDGRNDIAFVNGSAEKYAAWTLKKGAAEFKEEKIVLTSLPQEEGLLWLNGSDAFDDICLRIKLLGNQFGQQKIYLRAAEDLSRYLSVAVKNNILLVDEYNGTAVKNIFWLDLAKFDGKTPVSIPEDQKAAAVSTTAAFLRYADSVNTAKYYREQLALKEAQPAQSVAEGAAAYVPDIPIHAAGSRQLEIKLVGNALSVDIDGRPAITELAVEQNKPGGVYLSAAWGGLGWSQRNLADDVYDGVFDELVITAPSVEGGEAVLFDSRLKGWEGFCYKVGLYWRQLLDWFIEYL